MIPPAGAVILTGFMALVSVGRAGVFTIARRRHIEDFNRDTPGRWYSRSLQSLFPSGMFILVCVLSVPSVRVAELAMLGVQLVLVGLYSVNLVSEHRAAGMVHSSPLGPAT